jgi:hypothetical protein
MIVVVLVVLASWAVVIIASAWMHSIGLVVLALILTLAIYIAYEVGSYQGYEEALRNRGIAHEKGRIKDRGDKA